MPVSNCAVTMKKKLRFAVCGLRHVHIFDLIDRLRGHPRAELVAAVEEDAAAREAARERMGGMEIGDSYEALLREGGFDVLGVGDYYGIRGSRIEAALSAGFHVLTDKPVCTKLEELDNIEGLARERDLRVGCQLDMRAGGALLALREILLSGEIGEVHTISAEGQHPLMWGSRPQWYFEQGKHGGTINDIGIHLFDLIPWMTGRTITAVAGAREWNAKATEAPHFKDCAQCLLMLDNGGGVVADFSYLAPDGTGYSAPQYWRIVVRGAKGIAETFSASDSVYVATDADAEPRRIPAQPGQPGRYLEDFLDEIEGRSAPDGLTTEQVIRAARLALKIQSIAAGVRATGLD